MTTAQIAQLQPDATEHPPWLAHHFDSPEQQQASAKLGMWVFLLTELLFFGGLFCAYAVLRRSYPEAFRDGHYFLHVGLGVTNTVILLTSSLTMAWAVRCAQLDQRRGLLACLLATWLGGAAFLGIKFVEYKEKWDHRLVPGQVRIAAFLGKADGYLPNQVPGQPPPGGLRPDRDHIIATLRQHDLKAGRRPLSQSLYTSQLQQRSERLGVFFGLYFSLTGLHAIHVACGLIAIAWLIVRTLSGSFAARYYTPVDCVGLYWHLVDVIWIYLFPLLYLIH